MAWQTGKIFWKNYALFWIFRSNHCLNIQDLDQSNIIHFNKNSKNPLKQKFYHILNYFEKHKPYLSIYNLIICFLQFN